MKSKKIMLCLKSVLTIILTVVVCLGTTGCADILLLLEEYLDFDFAFGSSGSGNDSNPPDISAYTKILPDLPDADYHGYNFKIFTGIENSGDTYGSFNDIVAEELTGSPINDSVYMRNIRIEDNYNIMIKGISSNDDNRVKKTVYAGEDAFDVVVLPMNMTAQLATQGILHNLTGVPYIDFSKPWWDKNAVEQLSIANKVYFTTSDLLISDKNATSAFLFNKKIIIDYGLESPYVLVKEGRWTVDKMREMAKCVAMDLNGDGKMDTNDLYGLLVDKDMLHNSVLSSGDFVIEKDGKDLPVINLTECMLTSFDKWANIYYSDFAFKPGELESALVMFENNQGLFMYEKMITAIAMRRFEADFGILPSPKSDVSQAEYCNPVMPDANAISVPVTNPNLERTGIILEALSAESYYTLLPAYYDVTLMAKFYRDVESAEMLDIIFASRRYDLARVYGIYNMSVDKPIDFASEFEKIQNGLQKALDKTIDRIIMIDE